MIDHALCRGDECHWADWGIPDPAFQPFYEVSCTGRIWSVRHQRDMKPAIQWNGYMGVVLSEHRRLQRFTVHRLVASAFCEKREGMDTVDHLDTNKANNHAANLQWVTLSENIKLGIARGTNFLPPINDVRGERNGMAKLTPELVLWIRSIPYRRGLWKELGDQLGVTALAIRYAHTGQRWKHL